MNTLRQNMSLAALLISVPAATFADQVTISSSDGAVSITGDLVAFDDEIFVLDTDIGQLRLSRSVTACSGAACPVLTTDLDMAVAVNEPKTATLLQAMVNGFAASRDLTGLSAAGSDGMVARIDLQNFQTNTTAGKVDVALQQTDAAFTQLVSNQVDLAITKVAVPATVAENVIASGGTDPRDLSRERIIALDAIVPIVHPNNPVRSVSLEELALIASGRIQNWSELGGDNLPIQMLLPAQGSSLDQAFTETVLDPNRVRLRRSAERAESESAAAAAVASNEAAIAVTSLSEATQGQILPIRQTCGPLAYATDFAIKAEEYPLSRRVFAYVGDAVQSSAGDDFVEYLTSPEAQPLIAEAGYVDQVVVSEPISLQGTRMTSAILSATTGATLGLVQNFSRDLATADRLSTTFRFTSGSARLDNKSVEDVQRMVDYLNSPEARNREVLIIGFTDDVGRFDLNERLALLRATAVREALVSAVGGDVLADRMAVSSYGPLAPVGCNETADGRESNRRVEIWLR
ncbi:MAG: phosphate ABC transporter substrate-binding/OmpA family protein [Pseudomonadota bacterium]